jgi:hypothetical protein
MALSGHVLRKGYAIDLSGNKIDCFCKDGESMPTIFVGLERSLSVTCRCQVVRVRMLEEFCDRPAVIPAKAGIHKCLKFLDCGSC